MIHRFDTPYLIMVLILLAGILASPILGQTDLNPGTWTARVEPAQIKSGDTAKLLLTIKLDPGWHVYSLTQPPPPRALRIKLEDGSVFTQIGDPQQPKPKVQFDPNFEIDTQFFEDAATFTLPIKATNEAPLGTQKVIAKVTFQLCDAERCLPPRTRMIEADAMIIAANAALVASKPSPTPSANSTPVTGAVLAESPNPSPSTTVGVIGSQAANPPAAGNSPSRSPSISLARELRTRGLLNYIWFALSFGLIALLTPCVFPMIPITVSFFTKREQQSRRAAIKQALIYSLGIIFTFTGLGLLLTLIAGPAGISRLAASPWMNLFLTILFVVFALNLFGMFEVRIPSNWISRVSGQGSSLAATLLMGLTFTLTSFTCTAAFVGTVLVAATQGEWFWAAIGMFFFATAFASPFFLLAIFPRWLQSLPKSGNWLNSVKVIMGFLELAAAFKFLSNVDLVWGWQAVSRQVVLATWVALAFVAAIYLLGKFQLSHDTPVERLGVVRMLAATFFFSLAFYLLTGLFGGRLGELDAFLPPQAKPGIMGLAADSFSSAGWTESYDEALHQAKAINKPIFLNFTGVTCTNCRWMEQNMFPHPLVKKELERFVLAELFTDRETPEDERNSKLQETKFKTVALPLYVILDPEGNELAQFPGLTRNHNEFAKFLQSGANRFAPVAVR